MKKFIICALLLIITAFSVFGQISGYPDSLHNGSVFLNLGVGFGKPLGNKYNLLEDPEDKSKRQVPSLIFSMDFAIPFMALPFTIGFGTGFASEAVFSPDEYDEENEIQTQSLYNLGISVRLGYHVDFGVKNLDTYAHLAMGDILVWHSREEEDTELKHKFLFALGVGARYFFLPWLGGYLEFTMGNLYNINLGFTFKM